MTFHVVHQHQKLRLCVPLPDVHAALRQNDPSMATHSQPVVKKAPPLYGKADASRFLL